jgi:hypothetical protein
VSTIPEPFAGLVDDAAIFPPGDLPLADALPAHRSHQRSTYGALLGSFVVSDVRLPDLIKLLDAESAASTEPVEAIAVSVVVTGGAGAIEPAVHWATSTGALTLHSLELALRDEADLAHNARRITTALDQLASAGRLGEDTKVYVEPPRLRGQEPTHSWLAALDELAAVDLGLKFRTGGLDADAFPSGEELATCIAMALDRELRFKCTAGLHNAVRHRDPETGFEHHGFLNVLLATRVSLDGAPVSYVAGVLDEADASVVVDRCEDVGGEQLTSARRWFTSFGSCSVREPLEDLVDLDLLPNLPLETA